MHDLYLYISKMYLNIHLILVYQESVSFGVLTFSALHCQFIKKPLNEIREFGGK